MLNYDEFKSKVEKEFLSYMSEKYQNMQLEFYPVNKVNQLMDGILLKSPEKRIGISPTIYINDMYDHYMRTENFQEAVTNAARMLERAYEERDRVASINFDDAKNNIVFQLVNTMQNAEMLSDIPHREYQDLSIVYRWIVKIEEEGIQSTLIKNSLAENLGFNEEQLFRLAAENTRRILPPCIKNMTDVIRDLFIKDGMSPELTDIMMEEIQAEQPMWVITNNVGINGAASMLYEDKLHELAEKLGQDLYLMPSSIHEVIAVPASLGDPYELAQMVTEINMSEVQLNERLSNQVYHYDKNSRELTLATDTPNKSLEMDMKEETEVSNIIYRPDLFPLDMQEDEGMQPHM